jgi:NAD-dependent dihydropyrimidine dehydrogenase PreA subunit
MIEIERNVYRDLQESLDKLPINFPATESGVEIRILKHLFTPEKALVAAKLGFIPISLIEIHAALKEDNLSLKIVEKYLDEMNSEGLIRRSIKIEDKEPIKFYSSAPLVVGFYEFQLDKLTEDFVRDVDQYMHENFWEEVNKTKIPQLRTIPVGIALGVENNVATYDDMKAIIENCGDLIVVNKCICRVKMDMLGKRCKKTDLRETCFSFRALGKRYLELELGRAISKDEALEILNQCQEDGIVFQPGNSQRPIGLCCCCGCCCDVLAHQIRLDSPAQFFASNYYAEVESEACTGCGICVDSCNMDAIEIINDKFHNNLERCIGCGVCTSKCPEEAITLVKKQGSKLPPKNSFQIYQLIAQEREKLKQ